MHVRSRMRYELLESQPPISPQLSGCLLVPSIWAHLCSLAMAHEQRILSAHGVKAPSTLSEKAGSDIGATALTYALLAWMKDNDWPLPEDWRTLRAARERLQRRLRRRLGPTKANMLPGLAMSAAPTDSSAPELGAPMPSTAVRIAGWLLRQASRIRFWGRSGKGSR